MNQVEVTRLCCWQNGQHAQIYDLRVYWIVVYGLN